MKYTDGYTIDYSLLDDNVMSALNNGSVESVNGDTWDDDLEYKEDNNIDLSEVDYNVDNDTETYTAKVKKVIIHESASQNIALKGAEKMELMNLPVVWYRRDRGIERKQLATWDYIYDNLINANTNNFIQRDLKWNQRKRV